jgi:hypothetical protein
VEDDEGVFSRSVAVVSVRFRPTGVEPTRVAVEVEAETALTGEAAYVGEGLERAKGRVTSW